MYCLRIIVIKNNNNDNNNNNNNIRKRIKTKLLNMSFLYKRMKRKTKKNDANKIKKIKERGRKKIKIKRYETNL